jgi:hypothetical protein
MGEEKPDEELMGSKSSPRLATTSFTDVVNCSMTSFILPYTYMNKISLFDYMNTYDRIGNGKKDKESGEK